MMNDSVPTPNATPESAEAYNPMLWDALSGLGLLGGAIAALVTGNAAAGTLPVAAAVGFHLVNRRQLAEQMMQKQAAATAQITEQINQHQSSLTEYLQKFQLETQAAFDRQQQTQLAHQQSLSQSLQQQGEHLQSQLVDFRAETQQTAQRMEQQHQELVVVVNELRQMENCSHTIEASPQAEAYYQRGLSHQRLGDRDEAVRDYTEALRLNAELAGAYYQRGVVYAELGNRKLAVEDLRQASKLFFEQGDLDQYHRARDLGKEFYDAQHPFPPQAEADSTLLASLAEAREHLESENEDQGPVAILEQEAGITAANLFD